MQAAVDKVAGLFVDTLLGDDRVSHFFTSRCAAGTTSGW